MKRWGVLIGTGVLLIMELIAVVILGTGETAQMQDVVAVNEVLQSVRADWKDMGNHRGSQEAAYVVTDLEGNVLFATREGLSESVSAGIAHRDTMLDIYVEDEPVGKLIIWNEGAEALGESCVPPLFLPPPFCCNAVYAAGICCIYSER